MALVSKGLLDLPSELRNIIWELVTLAQEHRISRPAIRVRSSKRTDVRPVDLSSPRFSTWKPPALASVNRQLRVECLPFYYDFAFFKFRFWNHETEYDNPVFDWLDMVGTSASLIREISCRADLSGPGPWPDWTTAEFLIFPAATDGQQAVLFKHDVLETPYSDGMRSRGRAFARELSKQIKYRLAVKKQGSLGNEDWRKVLRRVARFIAEERDALLCS